MLRRTARPDRRAAAHRGGAAADLPHPPAGFRGAARTAAPAAPYLRNRARMRGHRSAGVAGADGARQPRDHGRVRAPVTGDAGGRVHAGQGSGPVNAPAAIALRRQGAPDLLIGYADAVAAMPVNPDARRIRRNAAARLLEMYPHLREWLSRPTPARLADIKRTGAWPFLSWCFAEGHLMPDLDLLVAKDPGGLYHQWRLRNPRDVQLITDAAQPFGWSAKWTPDVSPRAVTPNLP